MRAASMVIALALALFATARAQAAPDSSARLDDATTDALSLGDVIESVRKHHPKVAQARARLRQAEGRQLAAAGGFDPVARAGVKGLPLGKYSKGQLTARIEQPTPLWGLDVWAGYRRSFGSFPSYDGDLETLSGGEFSTGVRIPLWRDAAIDDARAAIAQADEGIDLGRADLDADRLAVEGAAAVAYWQWVASGEQIAVARTLLDVAEQRNKAIEGRIREGDEAAIDGIDSLRTVVDRRTKLVAARQKLEQAAVKLSLYLRDERGNPLVVDAERLPRRLPVARKPDPARLERDLEARLNDHPALRAIEHAMEQARVEVRLARNRVAPRIDLESWVAKDVGYGRDDLRPLDFGVGVTLSVPLALREARGKEREASAKLAEQKEKARALRDGLASELRSAFVALEAAHETAELVREARRAADRLAAAERRRFEFGSANILVVNLRELAAADAALAEIEALMRYQQAHAAYRVAGGRSPLR